MSVFSNGIPDTSGHAEGSSWTEERDGVTITYTIPVGNGKQTVDMTAAKDGNQIANSRAVSNGEGGWQQWTDVRGGTGIYTSSDNSADSPLTTVYNPGTSTKTGTPDSVYAVTPDLKQSLPLVKDGEVVGSYGTAPTKDGASPDIVTNVYIGKDGTVKQWQSRPGEFGGMVTNQNGERDSNGIGWQLTAYPSQGGGTVPGMFRKWDVVTWPDSVGGGEYWTNTETTSGGIHDRRYSPETDVYMDSYVGNELGTGYLIVHADGKTTKTGYDGSRLVVDDAGNILEKRDARPKVEDPDTRNLFERAVDGTIGLVENAWDFAPGIWGGIEDLTGFHGSEAAKNRWQSGIEGVGNFAKGAWNSANGLADSLIDLTGLGGKHDFDEAWAGLTLNMVYLAGSIEMVGDDVKGLVAGKDGYTGDRLWDDLGFAANQTSVVLLGTDWTGFSDHPAETMGNAAFGAFMLVGTRGMGLKNIPRVPPGAVTGLLKSFDSGLNSFESGIQGAKNTFNLGIQRTGEGIQAMAMGLEAAGYSVPDVFLKPLTNKLLEVRPSEVPGVNPGELTRPNAGATPGGLNPGELLRPNTGATPGELPGSSSSPPPTAGLENLRPPEVQPTPPLSVPGLSPDLIPPLPPVIWPYPAPEVLPTAPLSVPEVMPDVILDVPPMPDPVLPGFLPTPGVQAPGTVPIPGDLLPGTMSPPGVFAPGTSGQSDALNPGLLPGPEILPGLPPGWVPMQPEDAWVNPIPWYGPDDAIPWLGDPALTPEGQWPLGVRQGKNGQWYRPAYPGLPGRKVNMPPWATEKKVDRPAYGNVTRTYTADELDVQTRYMLGEVDARYDTARTKRDEYESDVLDKIKTMTIEDKETGKLRAVTLDDLSSSNIAKTIKALKESGIYGAQIAPLSESAEGLIYNKDLISRLSEGRGQIGGDFVTGQGRLETIHQGSGSFDTDRLAIETLPNGVQRVVLIEEKGGQRADYGTRKVDVGEPNKVNAQQGSATYGVDEFRTGSPALQALVDYDAKNGTHLAEDLQAGRIDFRYVGIHVEPQTKTVTVTEFTPEAGQAFNLDHPGTGQKPPTLPPPSLESVSEVSDHLQIYSADSVAPLWASGLIASIASGIAEVNSFAIPGGAEAVSMRSGPGWLDVAPPADQAMTINLVMRSSGVANVFDSEIAHGLTYTAAIR